MWYQHQFTVKAPLDRVIDFHSHSASMGAITPPPVIAQITEAPEQLSEGDDMKFTLWLGPIPLRWHARIEDVTANGFIDRQISGPFERWAHRHRFEAVDESATIVYDEIDIKLSKQLKWKILGSLMVLNLPILFAYRGWQTRRLLEKDKTSASPVEVS